MKGSKHLRECAVCKSVFKIPILKGNHKSNRQTCGHVCHGRLVGQQAKRWTKGEIDIIEQLSTSMPPKRLYLTYCRMAADRGFPKRSEPSFRCKLRLMGIPLMPELDWYTLIRLAEIFGTTRHVVYKLVKRGLKAERESNHSNQPWFISRTELKRFARKHPELFRHFDADGLFVALEDRKLVELILAQPKIQPPNRYNPTPVKCVETGQIYKSYRAAARAVFVDGSAVHAAAKRGHRAGGYHWVALK